VRRFTPLILLVTPAAGAGPSPAPKLLPDESGFPAALTAVLPIPRATDPNGPGS
jgi:hypothetical protein